VDVPDVVGSRIAAARSRLQAQPLTPQLVYKPAAAGQPVGVVLKQFPAGGTLSSFDKVTLVLAKPLHGVVPKTVGLTLKSARLRLAKLKLVPRVTGRAGRVVAQTPKAGVAAVPGMTVRLIVR
jgi:beta-lactam-binding protein with PASTA domain